MSTENAKEFLKKAMLNEELRKQLADKSPKEVEEIAKEVGFALSVTDLLEAGKELRANESEMPEELSPEDLDKAAGGYWWAADDSPIDGHELFCLLTWHDIDWSREHDDYCTSNYLFKWMDKNR